ncbi:MAG: prephenate dehydratase [Dethiobacter sp.]|jgi:prephenate dehydratase|nr:prephenate dehydratase [Dethiobacter sp.]MBS3989324.1 prephenate dehydratase [Dethiobacter sp.]
MSVSIAYLGPVGTFSEEAAKRFAGILGGEFVLTACATITACADAVEDGVVQYAVVPLENSLEGSVHETLDVLTTGLQLMIVAELVLIINHALLVFPEHTGDISKVYSHPQALAQCRNYLRRQWPAAQLLPLLSTADAAAFVAREGAGIAAIGSINAAKKYGLRVLAQEIQDSENQTRFVVLGKGSAVPGQVLKTSLLFSVKNVAGSLFDVLQAFAANEVNLTRIESRPAKRQLGDYIFFVDLDGSPDDTRVKAALRQVAANAVMMKLLGSYPVLA